MKRWVTFLLLLLAAYPAQAETFEDCYRAYTRESPDAPTLCQPYADGSNPQAMKMLADMYYWGWGSTIVQDYPSAMLWYKRAALRGQVEAKYNLGVMYEKGMGTAEDHNMAARWYLSAAKDGNPDAQYNIANMYSKGNIGKQNDVEASAWYARAANQGEPAAQFNMGNRYAKGLGVEQNIVEAYKWYALAERAGDRDALSNKQVVREVMTDAEAIEAEKLVRQWRPRREWKGGN